MEADALKNEVQKQEADGGKQKQEQLWGEGNPQQQEHGGQKTYQQQIGEENDQQNGEEREELRQQYIECE